MTPEPLDAPLPFFADPGPWGDGPPSAALPAQHARTTRRLDAVVRLTDDTEDWTAADWHAGRIVAALCLHVAGSEMQGDNAPETLAFRRALDVVAPALRYLDTKHALVALLETLVRDPDRRFPSLVAWWTCALAMLAGELGQG